MLMVFKEKNVVNRSEKQRRSVVQYDKSRCSGRSFCCLNGMLRREFQAGVVMKHAGELRRTAQTTVLDSDSPVLSSLLTSLFVTPNKPSSFTTCGVSGQERSSTEHKKHFLVYTFSYFFFPPFFIFYPTFH